MFCYAEGMTTYLSNVRSASSTLPVCQAAYRRHQGQRGGSGGRKRGGDRLRAQEELPQGRQGQGRAERTRERTRGWCASSRRWSPAPPTSRGTTKTADEPTCATTTASACTTTSTSSTKNWGCATCACPRGVPFGCSSTSTATTGWRGSWTASRVQAAGQRLCRHRRTGRAQQLGRQLGRRCCIASWTSCPALLSDSRSSSSIVSLEPG